MVSRVTVSVFAEHISMLYRCAYVRKTSCFLIHQLQMLNANDTRTARTHTHFVSILNSGYAFMREIRANKTTHATKQMAKCRQKNDETKVRNIRVCIRPGKIHPATAVTTRRERTEPVNMRRCIQPKQNIDFGRTHTRSTRSETRRTHEPMAGTGTQNTHIFLQQKKTKRKQKRHSFLAMRTRASLAISLCVAVHSSVCDELQLLLLLLQLSLWSLVRRVARVFVEMRTRTRHASSLSVPPHSPLRARGDARDTE